MESYTNDQYYEHQFHLKSSVLRVPSLPHLLKNEDSYADLLG
jgi:hypothetical protein